MASPLRTHDDWHARFLTLLELSSRKPAQASTGFIRLAKAVEKAMPDSLSDWHLAQTWQQLSLAQARAGDHRKAAATLSELAEHHATLAAEHRRAQVAATAASAVHLDKAGDRAAARTRLRQAERAAAGLRPKDEILHLATRLLRPRPARASTSRRVTPTA